MGQMIYSLLFALSFFGTSFSDSSADATEKSINELQAKIAALEASIREVKVKTQALENSLSHQERSYQNCQQFLDEKYYELHESPEAQGHIDLIEAIGQTADRVFPVYKDLSMLTCDRETYIAPLSTRAFEASSDQYKNGKYRSYLNFKKSDPKKFEPEGWVAGFDDKNPWIQVDLGMDKNLYAIAIRGRGDERQFVTKFKVSHSNDGTTWTLIDKTFNGVQPSPDIVTEIVQREIVIQQFDKMIVARYVRLHPTGKFAWQYALRWELYGPKCKADGEIGYVESRHGYGLWSRHKGNLNAKFSLLHNSLGWSANRNSTLTFIQMDFGYKREVNAVATQGRAEAPEWVNAYLLQYRLDNGTWVNYDNKYVFNGNSDQNSIVVNPLKYPFVARWVRLFVKSYNTWPSLRWELYGPSNNTFPAKMCPW